MLTICQEAARGVIPTCTAIALDHASRREAHGEAQQARTARADPRPVALVGRRSPRPGPPPSRATGAPGRRRSGRGRAQRHRVAVHLRTVSADRRQRARAADRVQPPVAVAPHLAQVGQPAADERRLALGRAVERRVGDRDPAHRVVVEPRAVAGGGRAPTRRTAARTWCRAGAPSRAPAGRPALRSAPPRARAAAGSPRGRAARRRAAARDQRAVVGGARGCVAGGLRGVAHGRVQLPVGERQRQDREQPRRPASGERAQQHGSAEQRPQPRHVAAHGRVDDRRGDRSQRVQDEPGAEHALVAGEKCQPAGGEQRTGIR